MTVRCALMWLSCASVLLFSFDHYFLSGSCSSLSNLIVAYYSKYIDKEN